MRSFVKTGIVGNGTFYAPKPYRAGPHNLTCTCMNTMWDASTSARDRRNVRALASDALERCSSSLRTTVKVY